MRVQFGFNLFVVPKKKTFLYVLVGSPSILLLKKSCVCNLLGFPLHIKGSQLCIKEDPTIHAVWVQSCLHFIRKRFYSVPNRVLC